MCVWCVGCPVLIRPPPPAPPPPPCPRYDPVHYGVPEGSYSTSPDGPMRVLEYREMVQVG
jgi:hypothetical protein